MSGCNYDEQELFEMVEGALESGREHELSAHLEKCPECYETYRRECGLSDSLRSSLDGASSCRGKRFLRSVAMALPTRSRRFRMLWGIGGAFLLLAAVLALQAREVSPFVSFMQLTEAFNAFVMNFADTMEIMISAAGYVLLPVLGAVILANAVIAVLTLSMLRRRA